MKNKRGPILFGWLLIVAALIAGALTLSGLLLGTAEGAEPSDPRVPTFVTGVTIGPWTGGSSRPHTGTGISIPLRPPESNNAAASFMNWRLLQLHRAEKAAIDLLDKVYFEFDSTEISERAAVALDRMAEILLANPEIRLHVDGHTDLVGTNEYNHALAWHRSMSVVVALMTRGIDGSRLRMDTFGEEFPVDPTPDASPMNRRVEITPVVILP